MTPASKASALKTQPSTAFLHILEAGFADPKAEGIKGGAGGDWALSEKLAELVDMNESIALAKLQGRRASPAQTCSQGSPPVSVDASPKREAQKQLEALQQRFEKRLREAFERQPGCRFPLPAPQWEGERCLERPEASAFKRLYLGFQQDMDFQGQTLLASFWESSQQQRPSRTPAVELAQALHQRVQLVARRQFARIPALVAKAYDLQCPLDTLTPANYQRYTQWLKRLIQAECDLRLLPLRGLLDATFSTKDLP